MRPIFLFLALGVLAGPARAVDPNEVLDDPALEARAREVGKNLRCLVCQNQSIDDSDADLAKDMRILVRERIVAGDTNERIIDYIVSRYGDFVLLNPPFKAKTLVLWLGPGVILLAGILSIFLFYRDRGRDVAANVGAARTAMPLSDEERKKLDDLLGRDEDKA